MRNKPQGENVSLFSLFRFGASFLGAGLAIGSITSAAAAAAVASD